MEKLPDSLSLENLLNSAWPGDLTLGELKTAFVGFPVAQHMQSALEAQLGRSLRGVRISFVDKQNQDLPEALTLDAFRALAKAGMATITIDEGEGGMKVGVPEPVL